MIDYSAYFSFLESTALADIAGELRDKVDAFFRDTSHGDLAGWLKVIDSMPQIDPSVIDLASDAVTAGRESDCDDDTRLALEGKLLEFCPWRKGPFNFFGIHIDTEWRSDLKWARLAGSIDLKDKLVLDVGCGNGYYMYRMLGAGCRAVVGVDPYMLFAMQFQAINKYIQTNSAAVLPLRFEDMPCGQGRFDAVFSMGLLYHRRDPQEHLAQLKSFLKQDGQLVLETIVLDKAGQACTERADVESNADDAGGVYSLSHRVAGMDKEVLVPEGRYAKMRNVWNVPTVEQLSEWLLEVGFGDVKLVEMAKTTSVEQRKTRWMSFESLDDFLDSNDDNLTIEGYPAPVRAVLTAVV